MLPKSGQNFAQTENIPDFFARFRSSLRKAEWRLYFFLTRSIKNSAPLCHCEFT
jgi:hypothetical protein